MKKTLKVLLVFSLVMMSGCLSPWGMNQQTQQERQVKESESAQAIASSDTKYKGPLEHKTEIKMDVSGKDASGTIEVPEMPKQPEEPIEMEHSENKGAEGVSQGKIDEKASFFQKNPWTLILVGVGLMIIVFALKKLWDLIKNTSIGNGVKTADAAASALIMRLKSKMAQESDPVKLSALKDAVIEAEEERAKVVKNGNHG